MHQHLQSIAAPVGKEIGMVRLRLTEDPNNPRQNCFRARPHGERPGREPEGINPDHRNQAAQSPETCTGHSTLIAVGPR